MKVITTTLYGIAVCCQRVILRTGRHAKRQDYIITMFTGLVESLGTVRSVTPDGAGTLLTIEDVTIAKDLPIGASVAVNGCCLTVVLGDERSFSFQAGPETLKLTNLGELKVGSKVTLENVPDRFAGDWYVTVARHLFDIEVGYEVRNEPCSSRSAQSRARSTDGCGPAQSTLI